MKAPAAMSDQILTNGQGRCSQRSPLALVVPAGEPFTVTKRPGGELKCTTQPRKGLWADPLNNTIAVLAPLFDLD